MVKFDRNLLCVLLLLVNYATAIKYFSEPGETDILHHYDSRFFKDVVTDEERQITLSSLIRAYLLLFDKLDLQTWIAHGTLLGWYWNGSILPWDWDLDTQVTDATLQRLGQQYNHTYHEYLSPNLNVNRTYLLDINAWSWQRVRGDGDNIIDARFIDTSNGMFLDITGLARNDPNNTDIIECKNEHRYRTSDIFPLRETIFEGVKAMVPYAYAKVLTEEYTQRALLQTNFFNHTFNVAEGQWQKVINVDTEEVAVPSGGAFS